MLAFHNGDTLENIPVIPVIRDEAASRPTQFPWKATLAGGAVAAVVGVCLALVLNQQTRSGHAPDGKTLPQAARSAAATGHENTATLPTTREPTSTSSSAPPSRSAGASPSCIPVTYKTPEGPADCRPKAEVCVAGAPWHVDGIEGLCGGPVPLQAIHIISQPATGGDPGATYCLAWMGSSDGAGKDATLLVNAAGYQCGAYLVGSDGQVIQADGTSVFSDSPQYCEGSYPGTRMTYPGVLDFPNEGGVQPPMYVCVAENAGA
ncbi:hypothetical protein [Streptomyces glaucescens]|uniref:hypothetical protein n=1 Tax=Streptomyces glaucescens TaxID=1907 RepID=UPI00117D7F4E|nr:hypothetical protein [Streptomyces glaucescens]